MHTKGKWTAANSGGKVIVGGMMHPKTIATLETTPLKITPEIEANARLIAAAPRLLAACKNAEADLYGFVADYLDVDIETSDEPQAKTVRELQGAIEAAESEV